MSSLDPGPSWADFQAKVESSVPTAVKVYDSIVPEDVDLVLTNGLFAPYVVVYSGGPIRSGTDHGLVSTRQDPTILYWTVAVYAPTPGATSALVGQIIDSLVGYRPVNCGEVLLEGGLSYSRGSNAIRPTQYVREVAFSARSNLLG